MSEVIVLYSGYSRMSDTDKMIANCSCTLIKGDNNIIVDTMTPWDSGKILTGLQKFDLTPQDITYVISTHGHSDHTGNNNLFLNAKHIVGFCVSFKDCYFLHPFDKGEEFIIDSSVKVIPTPGHTLSDVTVIATSKDDETVAIAGDLFENDADIENHSVWLEAGSEDPVQQTKNRSKVADMADWIIPGHGLKFKVNEDIREVLRQQASQGIGLKLCNTFK